MKLKSFFRFTSSQVKILWYYFILSSEFEDELYELQMGRRNKKRTCDKNSTTMIFLIISFSLPYNRIVHISIIISRYFPNDSLELLWDAAKLNPHFSSRETKHVWSNLLLLASILAQYKINHISFFSTSLFFY